MNVIKTSAIALMSGILLSACGGGGETSAASATKGPGGRPAATSRKVNVGVATEKPIDQVALVMGTLAAEQDVVLGMKVAGRIAEITVDLGSSVRKGDAIARLDPTDFELRVRSSEAALQQALVRLGLPADSNEQRVAPETLAIVKQAKAEMDGARFRNERAMLLWDKGLIPKADLDTANSAFRVAEARYEDSQDEARNRQGLLAQRRSEWEIARQQLADTVLYAPIDGMVRL